MSMRELDKLGSLIFLGLLPSATLSSYCIDLDCRVLVREMNKFRNGEGEWNDWPLILAGGEMF